MLKASAKRTVAGMEQMLDVRSVEGVKDYLVIAMADEWLAAYQYWVCMHLSSGEGHSDVVGEFEEHFNDEIRHAGMIADRYAQLGGAVITDPAKWRGAANPWVEVKTAVVDDQLNITLNAERDAIDFYREFADYVNGFDDVTHKMVMEILSDELEHAEDIEELLEER